MHKKNVTSVNLIPSSGGAFEVSMDEEKIFSKLELNRFPNHLEVEKILSQQL
jgi:selenoprotein W-related protein